MNPQWMTDLLNAETISRPLKEESPQAKIAVDISDVRGAKTPTSEIIMFRGYVDDKPVIMVKMRHHESGNIHGLVFTPEGMFALVSLGKQILDLMSQKS